MGKHGFTRVIAVAIAGATAAAGLHFPATAATPAQPGTVKPADKAPAQPGTTKSEAKPKKKPEADVEPVKAAPPAKKAPAEAPPKPAPKQEAKPVVRQPAPAPAPAVDQSPPKNPAPARPAPSQPKLSYHQPTYKPPVNPAPVQQAPVAQKEVESPSQAELATETVGTTTIRESTSPTGTREETKKSVRESETDNGDDIELVPLAGDTDVRDERDSEDEVISRGDEDEDDGREARGEEDDPNDDESDDNESNEADTTPVSEPVVEPEVAAPATSVVVPVEETIEAEVTAEVEHPAPETAPESVQAGAAVATTNGVGAEAEVSIAEDETTWEVAPAAAPSLHGGVAALEDQTVSVTIGEFSAEIAPPEIPEPINDLAVEATGVSVDEAISMGQSTAQQVSSDALAAIPDTTEFQDSIGPVDLDAWINVTWPEGE